MPLYLTACALVFVITLCLLWAASYVAGVTFGFPPPYGHMVFYAAIFTAFLGVPWAQTAWSALAWIVSRKPVADWLIARSKRTPYYPIMSRDGSELYMDRHWLFNAYGKGPNDETLPGKWERLGLPSIRVHHILRADDDDHHHDHPWNARTILLRGWYREEKTLDDEGGTKRAEYLRSRGYTGPVLFNEFHRISEVSPGGVYTMWFTWKYQGEWGFSVDGKKVPWREYLGMEPRT